MAVFEKRIPHDLSSEEALRRTQELVESAKQECADFLDGVEVKWNNKICSFTYFIHIGSALKRLESANPLLPKVEVPRLGERVLSRGVEVTGTIAVLEREIHIKTADITLGGVSGKLLDGLIINLSLLFVNVGLDRVATVFMKK